MNLDELAEQHPRAFRLVAMLKTSVAISSDAIDAEPGCVRLVRGERGPVVVIGLNDLESALSGFRDTGTWGDYFPPADPCGTTVTLSHRSRPGIARYKIDTSGD